MVVRYPPYVYHEGSQLRDEDTQPHNSVSEKRKKTGGKGEDANINDTEWDLDVTFILCGNPTDISKLTG